MKRLILLGTVLLICQTVFCQYQIGIIPRASPDKGIFQKIGYTEVEIKYGSPYINSREIWGKVVPYGEVWRAGANNATKIKFSTDIRIDSILVPAGEYALFIVPNEKGNWEVIFNSEANQWGAFKYKAEKDILRIKVEAETTNTSKEQLTYELKNYGFENGEVILKWEYIQLKIKFRTDYFKNFKENIEKRASNADINVRWIVYLQGAEYLENFDSKIDLASEWIDKSESLLKEVSNWNEQFYPKKYVEGHLFWTKAKILSKLSNYSEAIKYATRMKSFDETLMFYKKKKKQEEIDELIEKWHQN